MRCSECGHEVSEAGKSCPVCGGSLAGAAPAPAPKFQPDSRVGVPSRRQSPRVELEVPVVVRWMAKTGSTQEEATETHVVSSHGCTLRLKGMVFDGLLLQLENRSSNAIRKARVAFCGARGSDGFTEVAVEFEEPDPNFWGMQYALAAGIPIPVGEAGTAREERRRSARYKCEGRAGLVVHGNKVEIAGALSDISRGGCYIETMSPLAIETHVHATLEVKDTRIQGEAVVCSSHPAMGMGLHFMQLDTENEARLDGLLAELAGESEPVAAMKVESTEPESVPLRSRKTSVILEALIQILESKGVLRREELLQAIEKTKD